jgi:hypothetical protein
MIGESPQRGSAWETLGEPPKFQVEASRSKQHSTNLPTFQVAIVLIHNSKDLVNDVNSSNFFSAISGYPKPKKSKIFN